MDIIEIEKAPPEQPEVMRLGIEQAVEEGPVDTGAWLRSLPGVSGKRLGGHGVDPVIRGQGENRVNVLLDGAYVFGGCPNRMDPTTSYAPLTSFDSIIVIKGNQTVRYGAGGSGGTLLLERITPPFRADEKLRARVDAGYASNGNQRELFVDGAGGNSRGYVRAIAGINKADNYEDGDGNAVRSAYTERGASLILGYTPDAATRLELSLEAIRGDDIYYAGSMDTPETSNDLLRLRFDKDNLKGMFSAVKAEFYRSDVSHLMDNYSLRPLTAPMMMAVPSDSMTSGGRLELTSGADGSQWRWGLDYQKSDRDAIRYTGASLATVNSYMWPDVTLSQTGLFAETEQSLAGHRRLRAGARVDRVNASAGRASQDPPGMAMSPNQLYSLYYGKTGGDHDETNVAGFLRLEQDLAASPVTLSFSLNRSVRTADATERYMAANGLTAAQRWVGNPDLDPERHHQLELGLIYNPPTWNLSVSIYYDDVSDYILRDRAHGQAGILLSDSATIYRNVDATLYGGELSLRHRWAGAWSSELTLAHVRGQNTSDDRPIAQIPPLEFSLELKYEAGSWQLGGRLQGAARQTRVDDDPATGSGLDSGQTPGYAVIDLFGEYQLGRQFRLRAGIDNLFDRTYAQHLNRANDFDPLQVQINEPGRSVWLKLNGSF
ncbi:TonB-dependent copper receptor [Thiohalobacter sp. IOR34]|uniref:TonB-dependent copper receptor n=1 Tax=Thiohalobacter sp. IOR34 TaxID=3057176 RepID=UPI0025AF37EE|nr:TonB-dependent copper receptor [Thiohalobacter sp. IOR34]WJW75456.1 TonB-dependent copper receptor [Thiohalobacter sp. IOR34]